MKKAINKQEKEWLTAREIFECGLMGDGKTLGAVREHIKYYRLSNHPTFCRRASGKGNILEYHVSLFPPKAMKRRRGKNKPSYPMRGITVLQEGEGGALAADIIADVALSFDYSISFERAAAIRKRCIEMYGKTVMKSTDPDDRVPMPPVRVFFQYLFNGMERGRNTTRATIKAAFEKKIASMPARKQTAETPFEKRVRAILQGNPDLTASGVRLEFIKYHRDGSPKDRLPVPPRQEFARAMHLIKRAGL